MKKMKGVASMEVPSLYAGGGGGYEEDPRNRLKHQSLMQDYEDLQKDAEAMKKRLQMMKQKKSTLLAEVRFLKRRYKYLTSKQSMNPRPKQDVVQMETQRTNVMKGKHYSKKESALQYPLPPLDLNRKERINHGMEDTSRKSAPKFDLNHKAMPLNGMEAILRNPTTNFDLNQKERIQSGKESTKRKNSPVFDMNQKEMSQSRESKKRMNTPVFDLNQKERIQSRESTKRMNTPVFDLNQKERIQSGESTKRKNTPVFDLNQISREEEEFQASCEPLRIEEANKSLLRGGNDEQHNDMKLLVCRTIGNGSNRSGKRKITWQDQVALRV